MRRVALGESNITVGVDEDTGIAGSKEGEPKIALKSNLTKVVVGERQFGPEVLIDGTCLAAKSISP